MLWGGRLLSLTQRSALGRNRAPRFTVIQYRLGPHQRNKRVLGLDKDTTKTAEDRRIELCPRAVAVLERQLRLRRRLLRTQNPTSTPRYYRTCGASWPSLAVTSENRRRCSGFSDSVGWRHIRAPTDHKRLVERL